MAQLRPQIIHYPVGSFDAFGLRRRFLGLPPRSDSKGVARPFEQVTSDQLQIREGGGCVAAFGLPFFGAGVFLLLVSAGVVPVSNADDMPRFGWLMLLVMGVVFSAVGATLAFGRSWTTLDISQRAIVKQWGLLLPMRQRTYPLAGYSAVTLGFKAGDSDSADRFPVGLKAQTGDHLPLCSYTEYALSRDCAMAVAKHLKLDVEDASTDHPVRLPAAEADRSIRQRAFEFTPEPAPPRPATARSEVTSEAMGVLITIPTPPIHMVALLAGLIPAVIPMVLVSSLMEFFQKTNTPGPFGWAFIGWIVLLFGVLPAITVLNGYLRSRRGGTIVRVSRDGIEIQERGAWRTRTVASLDAADILEVDYSTQDSAAESARVAVEQEVLSSARTRSTKVGPRTERLMKWLTRFAKGRGLTVKTRTGLTTFAAGLEDDEVRYLHSLVRRALHGRS